MKQKAAKPVSLFLKYVDAIEYDCEREGVLEFLRSKLKLSISFPDNLFEGLHVAVAPAVLNWTASFGCERPKGRLHLRFATGNVNREGTLKPAIIWETTVQAAGEDVPGLPDGIGEWLHQAHEITHEVFYRLTEGELQERFSNA